jgi:hypothetical protein
MNYISSYTKTQKKETTQNLNLVTFLKVIIVLGTILLFGSAPNEYLIPMFFALGTGIIMGKYFGSKK